MVFKIPETTYTKSETDIGRSISAKERFQKLVLGKIHGFLGDGGEVQSVSGYEMCITYTKF